MLSDELAERNVLGACLKDRATAEKCVGMLVPLDFIIGFHGEVFHAIKELLADKKNPSPVTVYTYFADRNKDYPTVLFKKLVEEATVADAMACAERVNMLAIKRVALSSMSFLLRDAENMETDEVISGISDILKSAINAKQATTKQPVHYLPEEIGEYVKELKESLPDGIMAKRLIKTGMSDFDETAGGLLKGALIFLGGRPSMGKSTLSMQWALNIARDKRPVLYCSFEIGRTEFMTKVVCIQGGIKADEVNIRPEIGICDKVSRKTNHLSSCPFYFCTNASGVSEIGVLARDIERKHGSIGAIFIDRMELIRDSKQKEENRTNQLSRISANLCTLALDLDCPVVCLVQLSRAAARRGSSDAHRPILSDMRDCGAFEQDAKMTVFIHREEMYSSDVKHKGKAEIIVAKNMFGGTGTTEMMFETETPMFVGIERRQDHWNDR